MKVAIGIDGSQLSNEAVRFTERLLSPKVDDLLLYYSPPKLHLSPIATQSKTVLESATDAMANRVFDAALAELSEEMREVTETIRGDETAAQGLLALSERQDVQLVVVGSKSAKRKFPYLLGSTARNVVHHANDPILVVRGDSKLDTKQPFRVLIACDGDRELDPKGIVRDFSWPDNTQVTLFHVTESHGDEFVVWLKANHSPQLPGTTELVEEYEQATARRRQEAEARLTTIKQHGPNFVKRADVEVTDGPIVDTLLEKITRDDVDLLIISSRRLTAIGRMLGSVTESMLTRCPCSLLITHDDLVREEAKQKAQAAPEKSPENLGFRTFATT